MTIWWRRRFLMAALLVGVVLLLFWITRGRSDPIAAARERLAATGLPSTLEELNAAYKEPEPANNAAPLIEEAQQLYRRPADDVPLLGFSTTMKRGMVWTEEMRAHAHAFLDENKAVLDLLDEAIERPECRFPIDQTRGVSMVLPHLGFMNTAVKLCCLKAELAMEEGRAEDAGLALVASLRLAKHLEAEPIVISQLVRIAGIHIAIFSFERVLHRSTLPIEVLEELEGLFRHNMEHDWVDLTLPGEFLIGLHYYEWLQQRIRDTDEQVWDFLPFQSRGHFWIYKILGFTRKDIQAFIHVMDRIVVESQFKEVDKSAIITEFLTPKRGMFRARIANDLLSGFEGVFSKESRAKGRLQLCLAACALERYLAAHSGTLPETLDPLIPEFLSETPIDIWDGQPIRYRRLSEEQGYLLYSVGESGVDDGGVRRLESDRISAALVHETFSVKFSNRR